MFCGIDFVMRGDRNYVQCRSIKCEQMPQWHTHKYILIHGCDLAILRINGTLTKKPEQHGKCYQLLNFVGKDR